MDRDRYWFRNGSLYANSDRQITTVLISSAADLESETLKTMEPGTIAHTPGGAEYYELGPDHTWTKCVGKVAGSGSSTGSGIADGETIVFENMTAADRVAQG